MSYCGNLKEVTRVLKPKRGAVYGNIPQRVIYICPQLLGNVYIHALSYDSI
jgi:hypothetical protein